MIFKTLGEKTNPAIIFFHALGVTGDSSIPVAKYLKDLYYIIMPTSTAFCKDQIYISKSDEVKQVNDFLKNEKIENLELVVASSIGADIAIEFLSKTKLKVNHVFFDGGQFAQIPEKIRKIMTPFLYLAIKSLYWSKGKTLKNIMWCDDENIKPYFIEAGKNLTYKNMYKLMMCSLEDKPFPKLTEGMQKNTYWGFGSIEDHYKYRDEVIKAYPYGNFPIFNNMNHMQFQIREPKQFANMLKSIISNNTLPNNLFV